MSEMMDAVVLRGPRDLVVQRVPVPRVEAGQVLVPVAACGICGSDLRYYEGENPWAKHTLGYEKPNPPNMVLGHEIAARHGGEEVAVLSFRGCGVCPDCRRGREQLCARTAHLGHGAGWESEEFNPGGMAEQCLAWPQFLFPLPQGVSAAEGTFVDGLAVAVHAAGLAAIPTGGSFAVLGAGPIGLGIMQIARALGAGRAWVVDVYETALSCARELGAHSVRTAEGVSGDELGAEVLRETGGRGVDAVFESTGNPETQRAGLAMLARGGAMVLMAGVGEGLALSDAAVAGERRITTSSNHRYADFQTAVELMSEGKVRVGEMITHRFPLGDAPRAFEVARNKTAHGAMKVILEP